MLLEIWSLEMPKDEIKEVQNERGQIYGEFDDHLDAVEEIMVILKRVNVKRWGISHYPKGFQTFLFYVVSKLVRLVTSPIHEDSALDLSSYSKLWLDIIRKRK